MQVEIETGLFPDISNYQYHHGRYKDIISKSGLVEIDRSPRRFKKLKEEPPLDVFDRKAEKFNFGEAFHLYQLEPEEYKKRVIINPKRKTPAYKEKVRSQNLVPISQKKEQDLLGMKDSLENGPYEKAREILSEGQAETSGFYIDPFQGIPCKIRPDWLTGSMITWDLKTYANASWKAFKSQIIDLKYAWQAAMILDGLTEITEKEHEYFGFIVFETDPPYDIGVHILEQDLIDAGRDGCKIDKGYQHALGIYAECKRTDTWPGLPDTIEMIGLPAWAKRQQGYE